MSAGDPSGLDRTFGRYRAALGLSTGIMIGLSWPLWVDGPDFPRVPFAPGLPAFPPWVSWLVLGGIAATLVLAVAGRAWRAMMSWSVALLAFAILRDQNRFQPWAYQYAIIASVMVAHSKARALRMARWYVVGLYAYSGLSKLDASFCRGLGPTFLSTGLGSLGISTEGWPATGRDLAVLVMPAFEVATAGLLLFHRTRRIGLIGVIAQHSALLIILGPRGLDHSPVVLAWNVALIIQDIFLFGPAEVAPEPGPRGWPAGLTAPVFWALMILPAGERWGLCDAWPGHALYASHAERSDIYLHEDDLARYPDSIRRRLAPAGVTPWRRLDLTGWSRDVRGAPPYPSGRIGNAVAEFLEVRYAGLQPVKLVQWGRASVRDARRDRDESLGLRAIRRRGDRFLINAHPSPL